MRRLWVGFILSLLLGGCVADGATRMPLALHQEAVVAMEATRSVVEKRRIAALACRGAGYAQQTVAYRRCMRVLISRNLQRMAERADRLLNLAEKRHSVCLRRETYRLSRCVEI